VSDPKTGKEWEQVGVQPDVKADVATALDVAQSMALKAAVSKADASRRGVLETALQSAEARLHPRDVPAAVLARYAGEYEGGRRVSVVGRDLVYESPIGGLSETLIPLSDSLFVTPSQTRLQFDVDASGKGRVGTSAGGATIWWRKRSE
jgi:hypothetical protein